MGNPAVLEKATADIEGVVAEVDPQRLRGDDAARMVELFARGERLCAAGKALAARRVADVGVAGGRRAFRSPLAGPALGQHRRLLAAVVTDGVDVYTVAHLGRTVTAHQRTPLHARDPQCVIPGCHVDHGLEIDHVDGWAATRVTKLDRLVRVCHFHHYQKTYEGYQIVGRPGHWQWLRPDGTPVHPEIQPP